MTEQEEPQDSKCGEGCLPAPEVRRRLWELLGWGDAEHMQAALQGAPRRPGFAASLLDSTLWGCRLCGPSLWVLHTAALLTEDSFH